MHPQTKSFFHLGKPTLSLPILLPLFVCGNAWSAGSLRVLNRLARPLKFTL